LNIFDCILNIGGMLPIYKRQSVTRRTRRASDSLNIQSSILVCFTELSVSPGIAVGGPRSIDTEG